MGLIAYDAFGRLRLAHFVPEPESIVALSDWEYEEDLWIGEALGFSEWLRLEEAPEILRSLSLDLSNLPDEVSAQVLDTLRLPLVRGMSAEEILQRLGQPERICAFATAPDRRTLMFRCGSREPYTIGCTVHEDDGLTYVTVLAATPRRLAAEE